MNPAVGSLVAITAYCWVSIINLSVMVNACSWVFLISQPWRLIAVSVLLWSSSHCDSPTPDSGINSVTTMSPGAAVSTDESPHPVSKSTTARKQAWAIIGWVFIVSLLDFFYRRKFPANVERLNLWSIHSHHILAALRVSEGPPHISLKLADIGRRWRSIIKQLNRHKCLSIALAWRSAFDLIIGRL